MRTAGALGRSLKGPGNITSMDAHSICALFESEFWVGGDGVSCRLCEVKRVCPFSGTAHAGVSLPLDWGVPLSRPVGLVAGTQQRARWLHFAAAQAAHAAGFLLCISLSCPADLLYAASLCLHLPGWSW
jgi:hypothetical protein